MKKIKEGDLVFTRLNKIEILGREEDTYCTPHPFKYDMKLATNSWIIILLKYLGNGIFQEFSTEEFIDIYGDEDDFQNVFAEKIEGKLQTCTRYCVYKNSVPKYTYFTDSEELREFQENINKNNQILHLSAWSANNTKDYFLEIADVEKLEYLKTSDDERRKLIREIKKKAVNNIKAINAEINYVLTNKDEFINFEIEELQKKFDEFQRRR